MKKFLSLFAAVLFAGSMMAETYTKTAYADLKTGDEVIITMENATGVFAASNDKGTQNPPAAVAVTVEGNAISTEATNLVWTVSRDVDSVTFNAGEKALYCTNTNNGVRVGDGTANVFSIKDAYLFNNGQSRYIGVYNNQDFRCYTSINSNITGQTLAFFVKGEGGETPVDPITPDPEPVVMNIVYNWAKDAADQVGTTIFGNSDETVATVKIHENTDDVDCIKFGKSYVYADGKWIAIKPAEGAFKAGDTLKVAVCFNNSDATKYCMVDVFAADGATRLWRTDSATTINGRTSAADPAIQWYVLEADQDSLFLGRYGNTGMCVPFLQVARPADTPEPPVVEKKTCADVYSLEKGAAVELNDVTVTYVSGKNVWVKDASASMLLYLSANATWKAGDVLAGVAGTVDIYNGLYEVKPSAEQVAAVTVAAGEAPAPEELAAVVDADMNKYVLLKGVTATGAFAEGTASNLDITLGENTYKLRNFMKNAYTFEAGKEYNVTALVSYYNALQLYFISAEAIEPIGAPAYYVAGSMNGWAADAAYKLAADGELYKGEFTFAANDEFKVIGVVETTTTWYPDGTNNNYKITEDGDYAISFNPNGGVDGWYYGYFEVAKKEAPAEISCADVYSLEKGANVDLNPVTVTYANGKNVYVKDEKGAMLLYLPAADAASWKAGDVLTGVEAVLDIYNGLYELKPTAEQIAAVTVAEAEAPAPEELTAIPGDADINKYVILKGVSVEAGEFTTASATNLNATLGEGTFVLRNNFKFAQKFEEGKTYNIVGAVAVYEKNETRTIQLYFISAEEVIDPSGYFVVGNMTNWAVDPAYKLSVFPAPVEEYMIELPLLKTSQFKVVYSADGVATTTWFPEGMGNNYGENGEITEDGDYLVYFRPDKGGDETWFYNCILVEKHAPAEEVDVTIAKGLVYNDAVAEEGWWDIYGENDKYSIELSNISTTEAPGTYDMETDLDPDYCWIVDLTNPNDTIGFVSGGVTLAISAEGVVTVIGQLAGEDGKLYNINLTYTDPTPEQTVVVNITDGAIYDELASYGLYLFYGEDANGVYVQLEIWPDEFPGAFTTEDLYNYIAGSVIAVGEEQYRIFSVEGNVVAGATEGVYTLTADILCYNNTLYKVTMKIGEEPQGINSVDAAKKAVKALRNGILVIEKNGVQYNVNGAVIR